MPSTLTPTGAAQVKRVGTDGRFKQGIINKYWAKNGRCVVYSSPIDDTLLYYDEISCDIRNGGKNYDEREVENRST